ncbi:MAG: tryptophan synthase subunit alpha, partial [Pseudomonadota bacterium]|nr:tryptophan synthase subunit alpha [Pseudomonadota bacterium]
NPIERIGYEMFADKAASVGVDGVLVVDMPPEEAEEFGPLLKARDLAAIFLVAPTTSHARAATICAHGEGYLYSVSLKGVTGAATLNAEDVAEHLAPLRDMTDLPLCVGFGIRDGVTAAEVAKVADGVIVGSALVNRIADSVDAPETIAGQLKSVLAEMRTAMDA